MRSIPCNEPLLFVIRTLLVHPISQVLSLQELWGQMIDSAKYWSARALLEYYFS